MVKGRNTSVISLRLPDEAIRRLKSRAKSKGLSLTEYLKGDSLFQSVLPHESKAQEDFLMDSTTREEVEELKVPKVGPNQPCPCGATWPDSGKPKKFKHCRCLGYHKADQ